MLNHCGSKSRVNAATSVARTSCCDPENRATKSENLIINAMRKEGYIDEGLLDDALFAVEVGL